MTNATLGEPEYRDDSVRWDGALQHGQRGRLGVAQLTSPASSGRLATLFAALRTPEERLSRSGTPVAAHSASGSPGQSRPFAFGPCRSCSSTFLSSVNWRPSRYTLPVGLTRTRTRTRT